jgi:hypothetical protein
MLPQWLCGRERLNSWGRAWTVAVSRWTRTIAGRYGVSRTEPEGGGRERPYAHAPTKTRQRSRPSLNWAHFNGWWVDFDPKPVTTVRLKPRKRPSALNHITDMAFGGEARLRVATKVAKSAGNWASGWKWNRPETILSVTAPNCVTPTKLRVGFGRKMRILLTKSKSDRVRLLSFSNRSVASARTEPAPFAQ